MLLFPPPNVEQGDLLRGGHELVIITLVIIYQWKCNLRSTYHDGCGDKWVMEEAELVSLHLGRQADTVLHVHE